MTREDMLAHLVERECAAQYGIMARASRMTGEIDLNFRLDAVNGERFVAKLSHRDEAHDVLDFQAAAIAHVVARDPLLPVPRLQTTLTGAGITTIRLPSGNQQFFRLLSWQDGIPLAEKEISDTTRRSVGGLAARLSLALADFSHFAEGRALIWDMKQAAQLTALIDGLSPNDLALVTPVLDRFVAGFLPDISSFRVQVVHNDLNLHNLLMDEAGSVSGCLDFGDMVRTPLIFELAVAAAYQVDYAGDVIGSISIMAEAFHAIVPLQVREMEWLVDLVAMRAAMTIIISAWRASKAPENAPYLLRNAPAAKELLQVLASVPREQIRERLRDAVLTGGVNRS